MNYPTELQKTMNANAENLSEAKAFGGHNTLYRSGDSFTLVCSRTKKTMSFRLADRGEADFMLPSA